MVEASAELKYRWLVEWPLKTGNSPRRKYSRLKQPWKRCSHLVGIEKGHLAPIDYSL